MSSQLLERKSRSALLLGRLGLFGPEVDGLPLVADAELKAKTETGRAFLTGHLLVQGLVVLGEVLAMGLELDFGQLRYPVRLI
jgi:hypothetical protein